MAVTYDITTDLGKMRRLVADTVEGAGPLPEGANFSDDEYTALAGTAGVYSGAANMADAVAAAYAGRVSTTAGPLRKEWQQAASAWRAQAAALRTRAEAEGEAVASLPALRAGVVLSGSAEVLGETTDG